MDRTNESVMSILDVPDVVEGDHYNERSGLIILEGPRGPLLARYAHPALPPDPERFKFQTCFPRDYTTFEQAEPPAQAPADIEAYARPIERTIDPRMGVSSGASKNPTEGSPTGRDETTIMVTPKQGRQQQLPDLTGVEVRSKQTDIRGEDSGLTVGEKVKVVGGFEQPNAESKGVSKESSLAGLIPKTAITFPAADYLPDLKKLQKLRSLVNFIRRVPALARDILRIGNQLTG